MTSPPRQNVLYLTVDEWRGDCLGAVGHPVVRTPNLDRLAARGVLFANHWAVTAPCGPSRASLHTGMYLMNHRSVENGTPLDDRFTNIAREARAAGYDPVLFGYTDTSVDPRTVTDPDDPRLRSYEGLLPGFRWVVEMIGERFDPWVQWLAAKGVDVPANPWALLEPRQGYPGADAHGRSWAPTMVPAEYSESAFITDSVADWIDANGDTPWFVHASYLRPHPPYRTHEGYHDLYDPDDGPAFRRLADRDAEIATHPIHQFGVRLVGCDEDEREARQVRATYWGMMTEVDAQVGRLLDHLDARGIAGDTLVVLTSDHGDMMGDHWLLQKLGWWDESYHVPLIVADPRPQADAARGTQVTAVTEAVDVMPTICEWLGLEVPLQVDGRSLQPFLAGDGAPEDWRTAAHIQWDFRNPQFHIAEEMLGLTMEQCSMDVLRTSTHKFVQIGDGTRLLFDLASDPHQLHDVAGDPTQAGAMVDCLSALLAWRMRHDDRTLTGTLITKGGVVTRRDPRR